MLSTFTTHQLSAHLGSYERHASWLRSCPNVATSVQQGALLSVDAAIVSIRAELATR